MDKERKANVMRRLFNIPAEEEFLNDIECGLKKSWHKSGRLWIFSEHMCFYSNILGSEQKILIKNETVRNVEISKSKGVAGSTIDIQTKTDSLRLTAFKNKESQDTCVQIIQKIINRFHGDSSGSLNNSNNNNNNNKNNTSNQSITDLTLANDNSSNMNTNNHNHNNNNNNNNNNSKSHLSPPHTSRVIGQHSEPVSPSTYRAHSQSIHLGSSNDINNNHNNHNNHTSSNSNVNLANNARFKRSATQGDPIMLTLTGNRNNRNKIETNSGSGKSRDSVENGTNVIDNNNNNKHLDGKLKLMRKADSAILASNLDRPNGIPPHAHTGGSSSGDDGGGGSGSGALSAGENEGKPNRKGSWQQSRPSRFLSSDNYPRHGSNCHDIGSNNNNNIHLSNHNSVPAPAAIPLNGTRTHLNSLDKFELQSDHFSLNNNHIDTMNANIDSKARLSVKDKGIYSSSNENENSNESNDDDADSEGNSGKDSQSYSVDSNANDDNNDDDDDDDDNADITTVNDYTNDENDDYDDNNHNTNNSNSNNNGEQIGNNGKKDLSLQGSIRNARSFGDEIGMRLECKDNDEDADCDDTLDGGRQTRSRKGAMLNDTDDDAFTYNNNNSNNSNVNSPYDNMYHTPTFSRNRSSSDPGSVCNSSMNPDNGTGNNSFIDQLRVGTTRLFNKLDPKNSQKDKHKSSRHHHNGNNNNNKGETNVNTKHNDTNENDNHSIGSNESKSKSKNSNNKKNTSKKSKTNRKRKHHHRSHRNSKHKRKKTKEEIENKINSEIPINDGLLGNGTKSINDITPKDKENDITNVGKSRSANAIVTSKLTNNIINNNNINDETKTNSNGDNNDGSVENDYKNRSCAKFISDETYENATFVETNGNEKLDFELIGDTIIHSTPIDIFERLFETKEFAFEMHERRKSTNVIVGEWMIDDELNNKEWSNKNNQPTTWLRKQEYIIPVKDAPPFMSNTAQVYEQQRLRFFGKNKFFVDARVATPNIKFGDCFFLVHKQTFELIGNNQTKVTAHVGFDWVKSTWFKKVIESKASGETRDGVNDWITRVKEIYPEPRGGDSKPSANGPVASLNMISPLEYVDDGSMGHDNEHTSSGRRIDNSVLEFMHHEPTKSEKLWKYYFEPTWLIILDILTLILDKQVWYNLFSDVKLLMTSKNENLIILSKEHIVLIVIACVFIIFCWMSVLFLLWIWYNQSFYYNLKESNQLLKQQTQMLIQIINNLQNNSTSINTNDVTTAIVNTMMNHNSYNETNDNNNFDELTRHHNASSVI